MRKQDRINLYKYLSVHPKFDNLPERLQDVLTYLAAGYTDHELSALYKVSHGTPWSYRESIFKRFGFCVYEPGRYNKHTQGPTRAMTQKEIFQKLKAQGHL